MAKVKAPCRNFACGLPGSSPQWWGTDICLQTPFVSTNSNGVLGVAKEETGVFTGLWQASAF